MEIVEAESSIRSGSAADGSSLTVEIQDQEGNVVKRAEKNVILKGGENSVVFDIPWSDPVTWEPGRPYLYKANVALRSSTSTSDFACAFGFREVWCEYMVVMPNDENNREFDDYYEPRTEEYDRGYDLIEAFLDRAVDAA